MSESKCHIVLYQPVIPPNTGSIARLCACTGSQLHLIHPLGFSTDDAAVKRAGLDYWDQVDIREHQNWEAFLDSQKPEHLAFLSKFAARPYTEIPWGGTTYLVFGSEAKGLPKRLHEAHPNAFFQVPMRTHLVRSLNLAQCAAVVLYEGLRQDNFEAIGQQPGHVPATMEAPEDF